MAENKEIGNKEFSKIRNRRKIVRTILELAILGVVLFFALYNIFYTKSYQPYTDNTQDQKGFIAISYSGVQKTGGSQELVSQERLRQQLKALKEQGYETITTEDIYNYYQNGAKLPDKAVCLMFEDGRRDTAIFAQDVLEELNYKATIFTYPQNFNKNDNKFLSPDDLKRLMESSYWELGSNGYRLAYINVFDRYNNYLGEMSPLMFSIAHPYLSHRYNHYLMDYIRDKNGVPMESYDRMQDRIGTDYKKLETAYMDNIGYIPSVSILTHANTGNFGNNPQVSKVNAYWLTKLFKMNFNREGYAPNQKDHSIYDLTRLQSQAWWPANHLLMRINYDTQQNLTFETGDAKKAAQWELTKGACEFTDEKIYLTSLPESQGIVKLKNSDNYKNLSLDVHLDGNKQGGQEIRLRSDNTMDNYISVNVVGRELLVKEKSGTNETELAKVDLDNFNGVPALSNDQARLEAQKKEKEIFSRYATPDGQAQVAPTNTETGNTNYVPDITANEKGDENLSITLQGNNIDISVNGKKAVTAQVSKTDAGALFLVANWTSKGFAQRELTDTIYDAVFDGLTIKNLPNGNTLFTAKYTGINKILYNGEKYGELVVSWFVKYL